MADLPASHDRPTGHCTFCPRLCRSACPVETASAREALTPKAKMQTYRELARHERPPSAEAAEVFWGCSDCGACEEACLHKNPVGEALYHARALAASLALQPPAMKQVRSRFEQFQNATGSSLSESLMAAAGALEIGGTGPELLFGCGILTRPSLAGRAAVLAKQVDPRVGCSPVTIFGSYEPLCCGRPLREAGEADAYRAQQRLVADQLGEKTAWWVGESACLSDYQRAASLAARPPEVRSFAEALADRGLAPRQRLPVATIQVSCGLRHDAGREALLTLAGRAAERVIVPDPALPFAGCCGGRGGIREVMPRVADEMARGRLEELGALAAAPILHFSTCCGEQLGEAAQHLLELY